MKNKFQRFIFILGIVCLVVGVMLYFAPKTFSEVVVYFPKDADVCVFCRQTSLQHVDVGNGKLVSCKLSDIDNVLTRCSGVDGISVRFVATEEDFMRVQQWLRLSDKSVYNLDGTTVVCGYSSRIVEKILLDGRSVNVQLAFDGQTLTVGSPLILDSF